MKHKRRAKLVAGFNAGRSEFRRKSYVTKSYDYATTLPDFRDHKARRKAYFVQRCLGRLGSPGNAHELARIDNEPRQPAAINTTGVPTDCVRCAPRLLCRPVPEQYRFPPAIYL